MEFSILHTQEYFLPTLFIGCLTCAIIYLLVYNGVLCIDLECPINFTVPLPDQCKADWEGRVLDNPSIKVRQEVYIFFSFEVFGRATNIVL